MKYLVVVQPKNSTMLKSTQTFHEDQEKEMKAFVDRKVMSGMTCHVYEHRNTYTLTQTVNSVN